MTEPAAAPESELDFAGIGTNEPITPLPHRIDERHAERVGQCFDENHEQVTHWLEIKTGSFSLARDLVDEAFATLLQLRQPAGIEDLRAYLYRVAANLAARRGAAAAKQQRIRQRVLYEEDLFDESPEPALAEQQELQRLQQVLDRLPPRVRLAVRLRYWDELSYAEITERFRAKGVIVTERTVKRYVAYGLACCREQMGVATGGGQ